MDTFREAALWTHLQSGPVHVSGKLDLDPMGHRQDFIGVDLTGRVRVRDQQDQSSSGASERSSALTLYSGGGRGGGGEEKEEEEERRRKRRK